MTPEEKVGVAIQALQDIQHALKTTIPEKTQQGEEDFFILYPTMRPVAVICAATIPLLKGQVTR